VHALAQQVIADREPPWALQDLVEDMLAATPAESMRVAYAMALRPLMRQELAQVNSRPDQVAVDAQGQTVGAGGTADQGGSDTQTTPVGGAVPNHERSRVALFRASGFRSVVHVGTGRWQYLLDCTAEQLLYAAAENRRIAVANNRTADRYEQLVEQMRRLGVSTPRGLPYDVLKRTYNAA
jgi:hypothetical protein